MGYWESKVLPKFKKIFQNKKKAAVAEACKSFDDSKNGINKEFDEKKTELQPKVIEIYEASSAEVKTLLKAPKEAGLKKHSTEVKKFLEELVKIEFPGSKPVSEAASKFGPVSVPGPVFFVFEKVSTFIVEEKQEEAAAPAEAAAAVAEGEKGEKEKEIVVEEEKKEEVIIETEKKETSGEPAPAPQPEKKEEAEPPKTT